MESKRQKQIAEVIKRNFGIILQQEGSYIYGPETLVTVTQVKMSPDLNIAKIYLSAYNTLDKPGVVKELNDQYPRLRNLLGQRLRKQIRHIPNLHFHLDDTLDEMYRLNELFDNLEADNQMGSDEEE